MKKLNIRRGDIFYADLSPVIGSEQGGVRPVLIVQNDVGNRFSPTVIAAAITKSTCKSEFAHAYYAASRKYRIGTRFYRTFGTKSEP